MPRNILGQPLMEPGQSRVAPLYFSQQIDQWSKVHNQI